MSLVFFGLCLALGYAVQTATGFGAMIVATTLGAFFLPIEQIAPTVMPLSLAQTGLLLYRDHANVDRRVLLREILPWMGIGVPLGAWGAGYLPTSGLRISLGAVVGFLVVRDLFGVGAPERPSRVGLIGAGIAEGLLGTGGPLLVWSIGRLPLAPRVIRTTLTAVWMVTGIVVSGLWALQGRLDLRTLQSSVLLLPAVPVGLVVGESILRRLDAVTFRRALTGSLAVAALVLLLQTVGASPIPEPSAGPAVAQLRRGRPPVILGAPDDLPPALPVPSVADRSLAPIPLTLDELEPATREAIGASALRHLQELTAACEPESPETLGAFLVLDARGVVALDLRPIAAEAGPIALEDRPLDAELVDCLDEVLWEQDWRDIGERIAPGAELPVALTMRFEVDP